MYYYSNVILRSANPLDVVHVRLYSNLLEYIGELIGEANWSGSTLSAREWLRTIQLIQVQVMQTKRLTENEFQSDTYNIHTNTLR